MLHHCWVYDTHYHFSPFFQTYYLMALKLMKATPKDDFLMEYGMSLSLSSNPNIIATHEIDMYGAVMKRKRSADMTGCKPLRNRLINEEWFREFFFPVGIRGLV